jgi:hypothetical protein
VLARFVVMIVDWLESQELKATVYSRLSSETQELLERPPAPFQWLSAAPVDELTRIIGEVAGLDALETLGLEVARRISNGAALPLIRAAFVLFGETPAAVFETFGRVFSVATLGITFRYFPRADGAGVVEAGFSEAEVPPEVLAVLSGMLHYAFEAGGRRGKVQLLGAQADGRPHTAVRYRVQWRSDAVERIALRDTPR